MTTEWQTGDKLCPEDKKHVLAAFLHRFTGDHKPSWAHRQWKGGKPYPVQHATDEDWLKETKFAVTKTGRIDMRVHECRSTPSWPYNPELR